MDPPTSAADGDAAETAPKQQPHRSYHHHHHHHREAFASNVEGVLAMRLSCRDGESGRGCLRRVKRVVSALSHAPNFRGRVGL